MFRKSTMQSQSEAVSNYLSKRAVLGETTAQLEAHKRASIEGMQFGTLLLLPREVSQAAACDGNVYTIAMPG